MEPFGTLASCITALLAVLICIALGGCGLMRRASDRETVERAGERAFAEMMVRNGFRYTTNATLTEPVMRVAGRILDAARVSAYAARAQQVRWDVAVIDAPTIANAFATPGGRILVFTGLFPVAQTEAGLAAVLGHEVAHVLEEHSLKEGRVRDDTAGQAALAGLIAEVGTYLGTKNADLSSRVGEAVKSHTANGGIVAVVLPYSRDQEMEADRVGVNLAARAGYDPREALRVWECMSARIPQQLSARLSTHPAAAERRAALQIWSSDALILYRGNASGATDALPDPKGRASAPETRWPGLGLRGSYGYVLLRAPGHG